MGTNLQSRPGYSGHQVSRDPATVMMEVLAPVTEPIAIGISKLSLTPLVNVGRSVVNIVGSTAVFLVSIFKQAELDLSQMDRGQKAEELAKLMGYTSYSQCWHRVDDILAVEG